MIDLSILVIILSGIPFLHIYTIYDWAEYFEQQIKQITACSRVLKIQSLAPCLNNLCYQYSFLFRGLRNNEAVNILGLK